MDRKEEAKKRRSALASGLLIGSKFIVFLSLLWTSSVMFKLGKPTEGILILFSVAFFLIFNKLEGR